MTELTKAVGQDGLTEEADQTGVISQEEATDKGGLTGEREVSPGSADVFTMTDFTLEERESLEEQEHDALLARRAQQERRQEQREARQDRRIREERRLRSIDGCLFVLSQLLCLIIIGAGLVLSFGLLKYEAEYTKRKNENRELS